MIRNALNLGQIHRDRWHSPDRMRYDDDGNVAFIEAESNSDDSNVKCEAVEITYSERDVKLESMLSSALYRCASSWSCATSGSWKTPLLTL